MARVRHNILLDEKIIKAQETVEKTKEKYEAAVKELRFLMEKRDEMKKQELLKMIESSRKSYEEIIEFLKKDKEE